MSNVIRKISIGSDYKNDAMHYSLGQEVYGGHIICDILSDEIKGEYSVFIKKENEVYVVSMMQTLQIILAEGLLKGASSVKNL